MTKSRQVTVLFLLTVLFFSATPLFVFAAEEGTADQTEDESKTKLNNFGIVMRTHRMLEITNRTAMRIEYFIEKIYANESLIEALKKANLSDDFESSVILFEEAKNLLEKASMAIESDDYEGTIANITESMKIFREVYRSLHKIAAKYMDATKNRVIAQGLIVAMQRALERIDRIKMLTPENDENIMSLLDEAKQYLNITAAKAMLAEGNVTEVSHNLVEANRLIGKVYQLLRKGARMKIWTRMNMYLNNMNKSCQKILVKIALAKKRGVNVSAILEELGYQNETQFRETLLSMIMAARGKAGNVKKALFELQKISQAFWRMNRALTRHMHERHWGNHESRDGQKHSQNQSQKQNQTQNKLGSPGRGLGKGGSNSNRRGRP